MRTAVVERFFIGAKIGIEESKIFGWEVRISSVDMRIAWNRRKPIKVFSQNNIFVHDDASKAMQNLKQNQISSNRGDDDIVPWDWIVGGLSLQLFNSLCKFFVIGWLYHLLKGVPIDHVDCISTLIGYFECVFYALLSVVFFLWRFLWVYPDLFRNLANFFRWITLKVLQYLSYIYFLQFLLSIFHKFL